MLITADYTSRNGMKKNAHLTSLQITSRQVNPQFKSPQLNSIQNSFTKPNHFDASQAHKNITWIKDLRIRFYSRERISNYFPTSCEIQQKLTSIAFECIVVLSSNHHILGV